jgi:protein O-mannosyl-transferase
VTSPTQLRLPTGVRAVVLASLPPALVFLLYLRSLRFDFVWDDWYLVDNRLFTSLDVSTILTTTHHGLHYLPVGHLTLLLDTWLHPDWSGGFHLTSVLLFAGCAVVLHVFYRALLVGSRVPWVQSRARTLALVCTLVYCAHPLQVESVAFVAARGGLLALMCSLAALLLYASFLERGGMARYGATLALTVGALLSKQTAAALPLLLFFFHLHRVPADRWTRAARLLAPHFVLGAVLAGLHVRIAIAAGVVGGDAGHPHLLSHASRAVFAAVFYLWKFLWPTGLTIEYDLGGMRQHWTLLVFGVVLLGAGLAWIQWRGHRERSLWWWLGWSYLAALLPVMNLLPTHPLVADRYAQLPLLPLCPVVVLPLLSRASARGQALVAALLVLALAGLTTLQLSVWRNDETLLRHAVRTDPHATQALGNYSMILWQSGRGVEALRVAATLKRINPSDFVYDHLRGLAALEEGHPAAAQIWLEEAVREAGRSAFLPYAALGRADSQQGHTVEALRAYQSALELLQDQPQYAAQRADVEAELRRLQTAVSRGH